ncbi:hypothetical protein CHX27_01355 [Flavobacterium aurantiibacter]|uniref:Uncharacterized protein n=1 Tax=Flavobacterium aurantiibacter TaxID=2023067 RepID=A0A256A7B5_9FLAO|nr:hypothetical protein CHX27_01355 [Flavobacterium aurantiibacter]
MLIAEDGGIPFDYKIHCFNGKPNFIQVDIDRHTKHKRNLYNTQWQLLDVLLRHSNGPEVPKPAQLQKMVELAAKLSEPFFYARVDFYSIYDDVYFGEITFHPGGGREVFKPIEYDYKLGSELKIPTDGI